MDAHTFTLPGAQRIASLGVLDLDYLGAKIGELEADHVARDQARYVDDADSVERTGCQWFKRFRGDAH
jgi:hypothetical protein